MKFFSLTANNTVTDIQWQAYPIGFFLLILCLFTIAGNLLILYVILRDNTLHASKYYYIASLAFADLQVGIIVMPFAFIFEMTEDEYQLFPENLGLFCGFWHSMDIFASTASIFGLSIIGIDRYLAITKPIEYLNSFICKKWYYVLLLTWICSAAISFPAIIHFGTQKIFFEPTSKSNETTTTLSLTFKECDFPKNRYYILFISIASFYLPLLIMIYVYIRVYSVVKKEVKALCSGYKCLSIRHPSSSFMSKFGLRKTSTKLHQPSFQLITLRIHHGSYHNPSLKSSNDDLEGKNKFSKKKSGNQKARTFVGLVMGVFVFCWSPYFIYFLLSGVFDIRLQDDKHHALVFKILSWLGYTNSALDVPVYILTSKELRMIISKLCCCSSSRKEESSSNKLSECLCVRTPVLG